MVHNIMYGNMFPEGTCIQGFKASLSKKKMAECLKFWIFTPGIKIAIQRKQRSEAIKVFKGLFS